jgi:hypothetical protein
MILLCAKRGCSGAENAAIYPPELLHCACGELPRHGKPQDCDLRHDLRQGAHFDKVDIGI